MVYLRGMYINIASEEMYERRENMMPEISEECNESNVAAFISERMGDIIAGDISFEDAVKEMGADRFGTVGELKDKVYNYILDGALDNMNEKVKSSQFSDLTGISRLEEVIKQQYYYIIEHQESIFAIRELNIEAVEKGEGKIKYFRGFEKIVSDTLKKGLEDGTIRSDIDVSKTARLIAEETCVRTQGMIDLYMHDKEKSYFLPVEQMEFFIKMIKNEVKPVQRRKRRKNRECTGVQYDSLTGLLAKDGFYERVAEVLSENPDKQYEIVVTDIEKFKLINDNYGTQEGDKLLKYIADRISYLTDPENPLSARIGADKFFTLVEHQTGGINGIVNEAVSNIKNYSPGMNISLKFGIYKIDDKSLPLAFMCDRAALAANSIKGKYNVSCAYYDDSFRKNLIMEQNITNEMENSLANEEFQVYFQPKYDLLTESIAGAEALVRWNHPELGFISPGVFVPIFEKNGFITKMDMYVWEKTCQYISKWKKQYGKCIPISVNVSRRDIYNVDITKTFLSLIEKYDLNPYELHLEITETAYTEDSEQLISVIDKLKRNGFVIEMDDFGSGYSSLNMLSEIPIDILKLDMKFVQSRDLANNRNIMNFVMGLAKWMNLLVVAEGVETQDQINVLKALECNYVQGYFYSKPLPAEEFSAQLESVAYELSSHILSYCGENANVYVQSGGSEKILLVADSILWNCNLINEYFKDSYTVAYTGNGSSAWDYILDNHENIELIITDLNLQGMSGVDLIMKVRSDKHFAGIPIIATGQFGGQGGEEMALTLGASDFVQKPYGRGVMIRRVQNVLTNNLKLLNRNGNYAQNADADKAELDPDTGLYSQHKMKSEIFAFIKKYPKMKSVFLLIDIDNFKNITETYGYSMGKLIIKNVVSVLRKSFRKDEIITHSGGDEFCVFLPEGFTDEGLNRRMDKLVGDLKLEVDDIKVTCSVGICRYPDSAQDYQSLYEKAKSALLKAKESGKNRYDIY